MTFTAIMTHVQAEPEAASRLACARALAERLIWDASFWRAFGGRTMSVEKGDGARRQAQRSARAPRLHRLTDRQPARLIRPEPCSWVRVRETVSIVRPR